MTQNVGLFEAKTRLSELVARVEAGEEVVITRHNKPVAELRPVVETRTEARPIGPLPGRPTFDIVPAFFEPMSDADLEQWEGVGMADPAGAGRPSRAGGTLKVAESTAPDGGRRRTASKRRRS